MWQRTAIIAATGFVYKDLFGAANSSDVAVAPLTANQLPKHATILVSDKCPAIKLAVVTKPGIGEAYGIGNKYLSTDIVLWIDAASKLRFSSCQCLVASGSGVVFVNDNVSESLV